HAARKLRSKSKMSIGLIAPITNSPSTEYSVEILKGVKTEAHKYGYFVDIYDIAQENQSEVTSRLPFLGLVDGLIVVSSSISSASFAPLRPENIPVLQVNPLKEQRESPFVGAINSETAPFADLLEHLFSDHKYRNPVLVHVPAEGHVQREMKEEMFLQAADKHSVSISRDRNFLSVPAFTYSAGRAAWNRAKAINPDADVYICLSDIVAVPFSQGLQREGRKAAVTGYGNFEIAECFELTTIDQHICQVGSDAFQQLYYAIRFIKMQGEFPEYRSTTGPASLIRRKTCACKAG
ncbi:MAG: LacI family DNA-binding transcriptional regulator, partial [Spirochaetaceae bacterium]|nr:LacI family DNA-binding transcriptional regulator [Spirochaetaceae bacterium]